MKLKGKTIIELTDINTGQVITHEDENFLTNALSDICQLITSRHDGLPSAAFITEGGCSTEALMRGLLLFDTILPDDTSQYLPPKEAKMIGHGSDVTYSGTDLTLGSYNVNQSNTSGDNERTYVWDFTAEQANGIINSVCLTTQAGGLIGHGTETPLDDISKAKPFSNIIKSCLVNKTGQNFTRDKRGPLYLSLKGDYLVEIDYSTLSTNTVTFYKTNLSSNEVDIFKKFHAIPSFENTQRHYGYFGEGITESEEITVDITTLGSGAYFGMALNGRELYLTQKSTAGENNVASAWAPNTSIGVIKIDLETFATTSYTVTNTTGIPLAIRSTYDRMSSNGYSFGVVDGYLFARSWEDSTGVNKCKLYAINIADNTDVRQITSKSGETNFVGVDSLATAAPFLMTIQGKVAFTNISEAAHSIYSPSLIYCVNAVTFTLLTLGTTLTSLRNMSVGQTSVMGRPFSSDNPLYHVAEWRGGSAYGTSNIYFFVVPNVLMTINNLSSPVEKTPAQTMRIIYKITKAE